MKPGKSRLPFTLPLLLALAAALIWGYVSSLITLYADDFYYGIFLHDGWRGFWHLTAEHYLTINGRALVHFVNELMLLFGTKIFVLISPLCLLGFGFAAAYTAEPPQTSFNRACSVAFFLILAFFVMPVSLLRETMLWVTGWSNYFLPLLFVVASFRCQQQYLAGNKRGAALPVFVCFISGATTEQGGLVAFVLVAAYALCDHLHTGFLRAKSRRWLLPFAVLAGYLTVMLAPGTFARQGYSPALSLHGIGEAFLAQSEYLTQADGCGILLALVCLSIALTAVRRRLTLWLMSGILPAAALLVCTFWNGASPFVCGIAAGAVALYLLAAALILMTKKEYCRSGCFLLAALAAEGLMLFAPPTGIRTVFLPLALAAVPAACLFADALACSDRRRTHILVYSSAFLICTACFTPTLAGYTRNSRILQQNLYGLSQAATNGYAVISMDAEERYGYTMPYEDGFFLKYFREYYQLSDDIKLYFTRRDCPPLFCSGQPCEYPAVEENGQLLLPFEPLLRALGGEVYWTENGTILFWDDVEYRLSANGYALTEMDRWKVTDLTGKSKMQFSKWYIDASILSETFQLSIQREQDKIYAERVGF